MSRGKYFRHSPFTCAVLLVLFCVVPALAAQEEDTGGSFRAYLPVAITSGGQSPDSFVVSASARQVGIAHRYDDLITAQGLAALGL
jgi:hypothetical protein